MCLNATPVWRGPEQPIERSSLGQPVQGIHPSTDVLSCLLRKATSSSQGLRLLKLERQQASHCNRCRGTLGRAQAVV